MKNHQDTEFKDPPSIIVWLEAALNKEKEKYKACPVGEDLIPGYVDSQGWGYVVTGYLLVEQAFKALLLFREKEVPKKHPLSGLFSLLNEDDKETLREYYSDYRATIGGEKGKFPFTCLDDYLNNLDGGQNASGHFDWRYYILEEKQSEEMPAVSIDYLHEIVYGCVRIMEYAHYRNFKPFKYTHFWRMRDERMQKYEGWLNYRMGKKEWDQLVDRVEKLWGPDYLGRYDLFLFKGVQMEDRFSEIPCDLSLPIIDKRDEIKTFDPVSGYQSIGATYPRPC